MKFRKKPVVIEAVQMTADCAKEAIYWGDTFVDSASPGESLPRPEVAELYVWTDDGGQVVGGDIGTLEGPLHVSVDDWIITGVQGEKYPCKPDIFAQTYEEVTE